MYVGTDKLNASRTRRAGARPDVPVGVRQRPRNRRSQRHHRWGDRHPAPPSRSIRAWGRQPRKTGTLTSAIDDSRGTGLLRCDPDYSNGQAFDGFLNGCERGTGRTRSSTRTWWNTTTKSCPPPLQWFAYNLNRAPFRAKLVHEPVGVPTSRAARRGRSATGWPSQPTTAAPRTIVWRHLVSRRRELRREAAQAERVAVAWRGQLGLPGHRPVRRAVQLKNAQGSGDPIRILGFASFYVMDWGGVNKTTIRAPTRRSAPSRSPHRRSARSPACTSRRSSTSPGLVHPTATCVEGQLTPCRVTLVR